jgi:hypothetical protein
VVRTAQEAGRLDGSRLVRGVLTYDYFSMIRAIVDENSALAKPADWTEVHFPFAIVVLRSTPVVPWNIN